MTSHTPETGNAGQDSLDAGTESLLWNKEELARGVETLVDAKVLAALRASRPSPADVSDEDCQRFDQFVVRYKAFSDVLRVRIGDIFKNPNIVDARSIAAQVLEGIGEMQSKLKEYAETAKAKGNGPVLHAIESVADAMSSAWAVHDLSEDKVLAAMELAPDKTAIASSGFFRVPEKKKDVKKGTIGKTSSVKTSHAEKEEEEIEAFRWTWTDDELFAKDKVRSMYRLVKSSEEMEESWKRCMESVRASFGNWIESNRQMLLQMGMREEPGFTEFKFNERIGKAEKILAGRMSRLKGRIFDIIENPLQDDDRGSSMKKISKDMADLCAKGITIFGTPATGIFEEAINAFFEEAMVAEKVDMGTLIDTKNVSDTQRGYFMEEYSKTSAAKSIDTLHNNPLRGSADDLALALRDAASQKIGMETKGRERGNLRHALHEAASFLAAKLHQIPMKKEDEDNASSTVTYIRLRRKCLGEMTAAIETFEYPGLSPSQLASFKNAASFMLWRSTRKASYEDLAIMDPEAGDDHASIKRELDAFQTELAPKEKAAETIPAFRRSWTDEELFAEQKLEKVFVFEQSHDEILALVGTAADELKAEFEKFLDASELLGNARKKRREAFVGFTKQYAQDLLDDICTSQFSMKTWKGYQSHVPPLVRKYSAIHGKEPEYVEKIMDSMFSKITFEEKRYALPPRCVSEEHDVLFHAKKDRPIFTSKENFKNTISYIEKDILQQITKVEGRMRGEEGARMHELLGKIDGILQGMLKGMPEKVEYEKYSDQISFWKEFTADVIGKIEALDIGECPPLLAMKVKNHASFCVCGTVRAHLLRDTLQLDWPDEDPAFIAGELNDFYPAPPAEKEKIPAFRWSWTDEELFGKYKMPRCYRYAHSLGQRQGYWEKMTDNLLRQSEAWMQDVVTDEYGDSLNMATREGAVRAMKNNFKALLHDIGNKVADRIGKGLHTLLFMKQIEKDVREKITRHFKTHRSSDPATIIAEQTRAFFAEANEASPCPTLLENRHFSDQVKIFISHQDDYEGTGAHYDKGTLKLCLTQEHIYPLDFEEGILEIVSNALGKRPAGNLNADIHNAIQSLLKKILRSEDGNVQRTFQSQVEFAIQWRDLLGKAIASISEFSDPNLSDSVMAEVRNAASFVVSWRMREFFLRGISQFRWKEDSSESEIMGILNDFYPRPVAEKESEPSAEFRWTWTDEELFAEKKLNAIRVFTLSEDEIMDRSKRMLDELCEAYALSIKGDGSDARTTETRMTAFRREANDLLSIFATGICNDLSVGNGGDFEAYGMKFAQYFKDRIPASFCGQFEEMFRKFLLETTANECPPHLLPFERYFDEQNVTFHPNRGAVVSSVASYKTTETDGAKNMARGYIEELRGKMDEASLRKIQDNVFKFVDAAVKDIFSLEGEAECHDHLAFVRTHKNRLEEITYVIHALKDSEMPEWVVTYLKNKLTFLFSLRLRSRVLADGWYRWKTPSDPEAVKQALLDFFPKPPAALASSGFEGGEVRGKGSFHDVDVLHSPTLGDIVPDYLATALRAQPITQEMAKAKLKAMFNEARSALSGEDKEAVMQALLTFRKYALAGLRVIGENVSTPEQYVRLWGYIGHALDQTKESLDGKVFACLEEKTLAWLKDSAKPSETETEAAPADVSARAIDLLAVYDIEPAHVKDRMAQATADHVAAAATEAIGLWGNALNERELREARAEIERVIRHAASVTENAVGGAESTDILKAAVGKGLEAALESMELPAAMADAMRAAVRGRQETLRGQQDEAAAIEFIIEQSENGRVTFAHTADIIATAKAEELSRAESESIENAYNEASVNIGDISAAIEAYSREARHGASETIRRTAKESLDQMTVILRTLKGMISPGSDPLSD